MNAVKIVVGGFIAVVAGAALGILFAPDRGSNTRKKLSKQGTRYLGTVKSTASDYADTLEEKIESVKETAGSIADRVNGAVNSLAGNDPKKNSAKT